MIVNKEGAFLHGNAPSLFYYHYLNKFWVQVLAALRTASDTFWHSYALGPAKGTDGQGLTGCVC